MGVGDRRRSSILGVQQLTPVMESPSSEAQGEQGMKENSSSWELIRNLVRTGSFRRVYFDEASFYGKMRSKRRDLNLLLGVLGCPLAPIPLPSEPTHPLSFRNSPTEASSARYIVYQYFVATGFTKLQKNVKSMYATGTVKMACYEKDGRFKSNARITEGGGSRGSSQSGCFVLWQMVPEMWLVELVVAGCKVSAGSNGRTVWRHVPWLGTHAARGPPRPLRRSIQGLDPRSIASMFSKAECLGEKRIGGEDCFMLKVSADRAPITERSEGPAEVIRHIMYGYFSQRSGLLVFIEDSVLTRVQSPGSAIFYWETTIGSSIEDYREVDGVLIAHQGRSSVTIFRFGEPSVHYRRSRMEEFWRIDDVVFNVQGLSMESFIPPTEALYTIDSIRFQVPFSHTF